MLFFCLKIDSRANEDEIIGNGTIAEKAIKQITRLKENSAEI
jgi:hypothetical protein